MKLFGLLHSGWGCSRNFGNQIGVAIFASASDVGSGNAVQGNFIGTDKNGTRPPGGPDLGNTDQGVLIENAKGNTIGGQTMDATGNPAPGTRAGNIISDNGKSGILIKGTMATGNRVQGNVIGTDTARTKGLGNGADGIQIEDALSNVVGSPLGMNLPAAQNIIASNTNNGVKISGSGARNTIRINSIHNNGRLGIDLASMDRAAGDGITPNDPPADTDAGPNDLMNFPVGVTYFNDGANVVVSGVLATILPQNSTIDIYGIRPKDANNEGVDPSGFGEGERYLGSITPASVPPVSGRGNFTLTLPVAAAMLADFPFISATATDTNGSTSEFSPVCRDADSDPKAGDPDPMNLRNNPDNDGDGLCDDWEEKGIDFNGDDERNPDLDLPRLGADPNHKDMFVEIDWMEVPGPGGHSHEPLAASLNDVKNAFQNIASPADSPPVSNPDGVNGIRLYLEVDEPVPEIDPIVLSGPGGNFNDIKYGNPENPCGNDPTDGHFGNIADRVVLNCPNHLGARRLVYRYAVFSHAHTFAGNMSSGRAEGRAREPGTDVVITLGAMTDRTFVHNAGLPAPPAAAPVPAAILNTARRIVEAGTFMHELGHTLGLRHGGNDDTNCKPNYLSVMSYNYQWRDIDTARPLDYSRIVLPRPNPTSVPPRAGLALDENDLDEREGVVGDLGTPIPAHVTRWQAVYGVGGVTMVGAIGGPIDWNNMGGNMEPSVMADINDTGDCPGGGFNNLDGFNDWLNIRYDFRSSARFFGDAGKEASPPDDVPEKTAEQGVANAQAVDSDRDGFTNADDNCPSIFNPDQADATGDGIGDVCEANLSITNTDDLDPVSVGQELTYTVTVTNSGVLDATGVVVTDDLPPEVTFASAISSKGTCNESGGIVICRVGDLSNGAEAAITIVVTPNTVGQIRNTAEVSALEPDPDSNNNTATQHTTVVQEPPRVVDVALRGTGWSQSFLDHLAAAGMGTGGFSIPVGSGALQLAALPWIGTDQVIIRFDRQVLIAQNALSLRGAPGLSVPPFLPQESGGFSYNPLSFTAVWTLSGPLSGNKLLIDLAGSGPNAVSDTAGNALDGFWDNPTNLDDPESDTFPSGSDPAVPGRDFQFRFDTLAGDVNGDRAANLGDALVVLNLVPNDSSTDPRADVNADGAINFADALAVLNRVPSLLPAGEPSSSEHVAPFGTRRGSAGRASNANPIVVVASEPHLVDAISSAAAIDIAAPGLPVFDRSQGFKTQLIDLVLTQYDYRLLRDIEQDEENPFESLLETDLDQELFKGSIR